MNGEEPMLELEKLGFAYAPGFVALHDVCLTLRRGEMAALVGANGAGKSTLLLHINGLLRPTSGHVRVMGRTVANNSLAEVRRMVGFVFQQADDQLFMPTVEDDVAFGPRNMGLPDEEVDRRVGESLEVMGIARLRKRPPHTLSAGEKRSAAIASVLSMRPAFWVMDEPTAGLDPRSRRAFIDLVRRLSPTLLLATHDLDMAWELCPRTIVLGRGHVMADGPTRELLADAELMEAAGLELPYSACQGGLDT